MKKKEEWAIYIKNDVVEGHMDIGASAYAKHNHSSLTTRVPDDRNRSLEATIMRVITRTDDVLMLKRSQRQKWKITAMRELQNMTTINRSIFQEARKALQQLPYTIFEKAVDNSKCYTVVSIEGGELVQYNNDLIQSHHIPSGGRCDPKSCRTRQAYFGQCHHELAVRRHLKMSLFVKSHWHKRHLDDDDVLNGVILNMDTSDHIPVQEKNIQDSSSAIE